MSDKKQKLIVVAGPTAAGKSEAAVELARRVGGEIISADSMQVYKYMDIGSAKITKEEMMGVPHHLIDVADPKDAFDVVRFAQLAKEAIHEIAARGHLPILCGGTGFYIQAVTRDIDFTETGSREAQRAKMAAFAEKEGNEALHARLAAVDPDSARTIHPNNVKRVIRAIEYFEETGQSIFAHNEEEKLKESPYDLTYFVISMDRKKLYERIDKRVDFMMEEGLYDEVLYLKAMGLSRSDISMQGLGYKEMLDCIDGKVSLEETVRILKRDTRHFAKRQITWFKREKDAIWLDRDDFDNDSIRIAEHMKKLIEG